VVQPNNNRAIKKVLLCDAGTNEYGRQQKVGQGGQIDPQNLWLAKQAMLYCTKYLYAGTENTILLHQDIFKIHCIYENRTLDHYMHLQSFFSFYKLKHYLRFTLN
jgi:hypothetical protein